MQKTNYGRPLGALVVASLLTVTATAAQAQVSFVNKVTQTGTASLSFGRGSAMVDVNDDGLLDIIAGNAGMENDFFVQQPDGTFERKNAAWGVAVNDAETIGVLVADFDNDGDLDVYFLNGGRDAPERNQMLRNDLATSGVLVDVSAESGAAGEPTATFGGSALDYDNDGDLDVIITNPFTDQPNTFLRNDGGLRFTDVSQQSGIVHPGAFLFSGAADIDNDGWIDIGVGQPSGANVVYRNNRNGTFSEVAAEVGLDSPFENFGMVFDDFNNDGWVDVYLPKYQISAPFTQSGLLLNNGNGTFRDVSVDSGITGQSDMGHNVNDVDADGYPDILVGTGNPHFEDVDRLFLITPDGAGSLIATDASESSGIQADGPTRQHGQAFGDFDGDGDIDIYVNNGGPLVFPDTVEDNSLFENQGNANRWLAFDLQGVLSNRSAVGARGAVLGETGREVHRYIAVGKGFANTNDLTMHFGMGTENSARLAVFRWPSGIMQMVSAPALSQTHAVVETGIKGGSVADIGNPYRITFVGPSGYEARLMFATAATVNAWPAWGGTATLTPPVSQVTTVTLGASGLASLEINIPDNPVLAGQTAYYQAWIAEPGASSGGTFSNVLAVSMQ